MSLDHMVVQGLFCSILLPTLHTGEYPIPMGVLQVVVEPLLGLEVLATDVAAPVLGPMHLPLVPRHFQIMHTGKLTKLALAHFVVMDLGHVAPVALSVFELSIANGASPWTNQTSLGELLQGRIDVSAPDVLDCIFLPVELLTTGAAGEGETFHVDRHMLLHHNPARGMEVTSLSGTGIQA